MDQPRVNIVVGELTDISESGLGAHASAECGGEWHKKTPVLKSVFFFSFGAVILQAFVVTACLADNKGAAVVS
jgi:hypothetical protein